MARFSRKKLLALLDDISAPVDSISYETYGRDTRAYVGVGTPGNRTKLEARLQVEGYTVNKNYFPGSSIVEVYITYFKAKGWDE